MRSGGWLAGITDQRVQPGHPDLVRAFTAEVQIDEVEGVEGFEYAPKRGR